MKSKLTSIFVLIFCLFPLTSCVQRIPGPQEVPVDKTGKALFRQAESEVAASNPDQALVLYATYLETYPGGPRAAEALMKMGNIYFKKEDYDRAKQNYDEILARYADSPLAGDAGVQVLKVLYLEKKYEEMIQRSSQLMASVTTRDNFEKGSLLLADAYFQAGYLKEGIDLLEMVLKKAGDEEKKRVERIIHARIASLPADDLKKIADGLDETSLVRAYVIYKLGMAMIMEERYESAIEALTVFADQYPDHEKHQQAVEFIEALSKKSAYDHFSLGCLLPLTGRYKRFGAMALEGIQLAMSRFNSQGSRPAINIVIKDTGSDDAKAARAAAEMARSGVAAMIGPIAAAESAAAIAQQYGIPIITFTRKGSVPGIGDYVFQNFLTPEMQARTMVRYTTQALGIERFAILYPDEPYGTDFMNRFWDQVVAHGASVVGVEHYDPKANDFGDPIKKLVGLHHNIPAYMRPPPKKKSDKNGKKDQLEPIVDFEAVFIPDSPEKAGLVIPQLAYYDVDDVILLGPNLWHADKIIEMAGGYMQDALLTEVFFADSNNKMTTEFTQVFRDTFGFKPGFMHAIAYDTARIILGLLARPDIRFRSTLRNELLAPEGFEGVTGKTRFTIEGIAEKELYLLKVKGRSFVEVDQNAEELGQR